MPPEYITTKLVHEPSGSGGISAALPGTDPGTGAWTEVIASAPAAYLLAGIDVSLFPAPHGFYDAYCQVQVGVGPVSSEVVIATFPITHISVDESHCDMMSPIPIDLIPAASRVSVRVLRWNESSPTTAFDISLHLYEKPISGLLTTTTQPLKIFPASALPFISASSAGSFANGSWVQVSASLPADIVLCGYHFLTNGNGVSAFLDVGVGGAGSEVVKTTFLAKQSSQTGALIYVALPRPLDVFPAGSRLAVRTRSSSGATIFISLLYMEKPL